MNKQTRVRSGNGNYSALKRYELSRHTKTWRGLTYMILSERNQTEKMTYYVILTIRHSGKGKTMVTVKDQ